MPKTTFLDFSETCERIGSTRKKLEKVQILSEYILKLGEEDLQRVSRFLAGYIFPRSSGKEVFTGYVSLHDIVSEITGVDERQFEEVYRKYGDLGSAAEELFASRSVVPLFRMELTVEEVEKAFQKMSDLTGHGSSVGRKKVLKGLLLSASPREAKYLVKILAGELRIGLVEGLVEDGLSKAFDHSLGDVRAANLVTGDIGLTATMAKDNRLSEARIELMRPTNFMLADTMKTSREIADYYRKELFAEYKYDGVRVQLHKRDGQIRMFSRKLEDISYSFPEVVGAGKRLSADVILDGEVLPFKNENPLPFHELQRRLRRKKTSKALLDAVPVVFFAYDLLYLDRKSLLKTPLRKRRRVLESLFSEGLLRRSHLFTVRTEGEIQKVFEQSRDLGYEGLVIKEPGSPYTPGRRGKQWVKLKEELDTLDVVVVAAEYGHGKRAGTISDYTFAVRGDGELLGVGKAYSGLSDEEIGELTGRVKQITLEDQGFRRLVKPEIVLEVAFDNVQKSGRHSSGYALRFPRIKRIRYDRAPDEIDTLKNVEKIYLGQKASRR